MRIIVSWGRARKGRGRDDGGMFLRNQFSGHMSTKYFLFLPKSTMVISVFFFVCLKFYFIVLDYWKHNMNVTRPGASQASRPSWVQWEKGSVNAALSNGGGQNHSSVLAGAWPVF